MNLHEMANEINQTADAARRAVDDKEKVVALHYRRVSYFKEFGNKWFSELAKQIEILAETFNKTAGDEATLKAYLDTSSGVFSIAIEFTPRNASTVCANARCSVVQEQDNLRVVVQAFDGSRASNLECDAKIVDFMEFKVNVTLIKREQIINEEATDRYCNINDKHFFPMFKTVTHQEKKLLTTGEFAEFVLTRLVGTGRKRHRA